MATGSVKRGLLTYNEPRTATAIQHALAMNCEFAGVSNSSSDLPLFALLKL